MLFTDLFTVLLSGDETEGQFGIITADSPAGDIIPTHSHNETHETFYVLEGKVRLFYAGRRGRQALRAAERRRLRLRAGRLRARVQDRGSRPHDGHPLRRLRAVLPAHGHRDRPRRPRTSRRSSPTSRACRPRPSSTTCSSSRATTTGRTRRSDRSRPESRATPASRCRRRPTSCRSRPPTRAPAAPACSSASRTRRPRASARWSWTSYLPPESDGPVPVVVFLHGGGWRLGSRHAAGPAYRGASPTPFERLAQAGHRRRERRLPALRRGDLAGPAARRQGRRPLAARPRRQTSASTRTGSPPGASRPAATSPRCSA